MTTVRVEAPARLHMGMLDASGAGARRFGGLGVAVTRPAAIVEASASDELTVEGPGAERARAVAERCLAALGDGRAARVRVLEAIPPHAGLGSGTKLALAVTAALAALTGSRPSRRRWRGWPVAAPARPWGCGRSRSAASSSRAAGAAAPRARRRS